MHVTVCICTYRRQELLRRLLAELEHQVTGGAFTFSIVVTDNDAALSAQRVVEDFASHSSIDVVYCTEPRRNIALARNRAIEHARGDYVAWIDDDEFPASDWLWQLTVTVERYGVAGVLGPVRPDFDGPPPRWLIEGRFCERTEYTTGTLMHWRQSFAGNALLKLELLRQAGAPFRAEFGLGGEDVDFFRRMALRGQQFVWCSEAAVYEVVARSRCTRSYRLKRAMMLGTSTVRLEGVRGLLKSCVAVPFYVLILPVTMLFGQHVFMVYSVKLSSHLGRLLALFGLNPITQRPA